MLGSFPFLPSARSALAALAVAAALLAAGPARAATIFHLTLSAESELVPSVGAPAPLTGTLRVEIGDLPLAGNTTIRLLDVDVAGGGVSVMLDPAVPSAGLGVLAAGGSFLIPPPFLVVDAGAGLLDLAIPNLVGSVELDEFSLLRLATSFDVDTLGPEGIVTVHVVAVPEPATGIFAGLGLAVIAARRARREGSR